MHFILSDEWIKRQFGSLQTQKLFSQAEKMQKGRIINCSKISILKQRQDISVFILITKNFYMLQSSNKEEDNNGRKTIEILNDLDKAENSGSLQKDHQFSLLIKHPAAFNELPLIINNSNQTFKGFSDIDQFLTFSVLTQEETERSEEIKFDMIQPQENVQKPDHNFNHFEGSIISNITSESCLTGNFKSQSMKIKRQKSRKPRKIIGQNQSRRKHNSQKSIIGYIAKRAIKMVLKKYQQKLSRDCKEAKIEFQDFLNYYQDQKEKLYGPERIAVMLRRSERDGQTKRKMKSIFYPYFEKVLRRDYLIKTLKSGKMTDLQQYLCKKNNYLLYFAESI